MGRKPWILDAPAQFPLLHGAVERGDNKHGHDHDRHAAEAGNGHGDHDIRPAAGAGQQGDQRQDGGCGGHQAGPNPPQPRLQRRFSGFVGCCDPSPEEALIEVGCDDHAVVAGDAE